MSPTGVLSLNMQLVLYHKQQRHNLRFGSTWEREICIALALQYPIFRT